MNDRLDRLDAVASRLGSEVAALRESISELRRSTGATPTGSPVDKPGAEPSRIDALNAAFGGTAAVARDQEANAPSPAPRPASSWNDLFKTLGMQPQPSAANSPPRRSGPAPQRRGIEELVGRYGTIALASLTILMGVGALIGWAMRNGYIGPATRVGVGLGLAAVTAFFGWRVRSGDSPRFGNLLLALALAIVHVVAWGAGPRLHLISTPAVLTLAALSSGALAALAWHDDDQALFNVGFGGALLAPFVTSTGGGSAVMLLSYGFLVLGAGIVSLGQRSWTRSPVVASLGVLVFTVVGVNLAQGAQGWAVRSAPGAFAVGLSALASVLLEGEKRMAITYPSLAVAFGAMLALANGRTSNAAQYPFAVALALATRFAGDALKRGLRTALVGAILLPAGATALALGSLQAVVSLTGGATALLFALLSGIWAWQNATGERRTHAFTATALAGLAVPLLSDEREVLFCVAIAVFGLACAFATQRVRLLGIGIAGALWLGIGTAVGFGLLERRVAYEYTPFLTQASLAAGVIALAWIMLSFHTARQLSERSRFTKDLPRILIRILGGVVAFFWIRQELAHAVSPDVSAFLVVAWYAVSGVGSIFLGRARQLPVLRQLGLGLSVLAALATITQASALAIGWRVGSYLLTGVFLLGVAYSYRVTRAAADGQPGTGPPQEAPVA